MKIENLTEARKPRKKLTQDPLRYNRRDLEPVLSRETLAYHYGKLASAYVERYNNGEGDADFNQGGATLHNIYFAQFQKPQDNNDPKGLFAALINRKYDSYNKFRDEVEKTAMSIQGSGWVYVNKQGTIKTIVNHELPSDSIVLLIDWWEHAWALDYQHEKKKYLKNIWSIINWDQINSRLKGV
jgi:Fe-Mn family superoxide dismutase